MLEVIAQVALWFGAFVVGVIVFVSAVSWVLYLMWETDPEKHDVSGGIRMEPKAPPLR